MNQKAQIFQYLIPIMFLAMGLFFLLTSSFSPSTEIKGQWHIDFLHDSLYEAEVDLLELDQDARNFCYDMALQVAGNGGFISNSECGTYNNRQKWNREDQWCIQNIKNNLDGLYKEHFLPREFTEIIFTENFIAGKSGKKTIDSSQEYKQTYTYNYDFNVDLNYNFDEYAILEQDARALVTVCKNETDLEACIDNKLDHKQYWELCEDSLLSKEVAFCVRSPLNAVIKGTSLIYEFALDFN